MFSTEDTAVPRDCWQVLSGFLDLPQLEVPWPQEVMEIEMDRDIGIDIEMQTMRDIENRYRDVGIGTNTDIDSDIDTEVTQLSPGCYPLFGFPSMSFNWPYMSFIKPEPKGRQYRGG